MLTSDLLARFLTGFKIFLVFGDVVFTFPFGTLQSVAPNRPTADPPSECHTGKYAPCQRLSFRLDVGAQREKSARKEGPNAPTCRGQSLSNSVQGPQRLM